jgi:uncharacterized protein (DUF1330 family)
MLVLKLVFVVAVVAIVTYFVANASNATKVLASSATPPKGYAIAEITVTDPEAYKQYAAAVPAIAAKFGGKYIIRAGNVIPVEGQAPTGRFVVIEFPSMANAQAFEASPEYRAVAPIRQKASTGRLFLIEGTIAP